MMGHKIWFYREIWLIIPTGANPCLKEATTERGEGNNDADRVAFPEGAQFFLNTAIQLPR